MARNKLRITILVVILFSILVGFIYFKYDSSSGRIYKRKSDLCLDFAQSHLRTIPKTEPNFSYNNEKWKMAIDVETELYKLCLLDLNSKSLSTFKPTSLNKYLNK